MLNLLYNIFYPHNINKFTYLLNYKSITYILHRITNKSKSAQTAIIKTVRIKNKIYYDIHSNLLSFRNIENKQINMKK